MSRLRIHRVILFLAAFAIIARALIPAGFMPDIGGEKFHLVICSADGNATADVDAKYNPFGHAKKSSPVCDFSLIKHLAFNTPPLVQVFVLLLLSFIVFRVLRTQLRYRLSDYVPGNPRAPPFAIV
jgi:hypothetical protein